MAEPLPFEDADMFIELRKHDHLEVNHNDDAVHTLHQSRLRRTEGLAF